jgi:hypothetical protein
MIIIPHNRKKVYLFIHFFPEILILTEVHGRRCWVLIPELVSYYLFLLQRHTSLQQEEDLEEFASKVQRD